MKRFFTLWALLCTLSEALLATNPPTTSATLQTPTDSHLFGHVVDATTGEHLAYVTVSLEGTPTGTTTDATGHFLLRNLRAGTYNVVVEAVGYKSASKEVTIRKGETIELDFAIESMPLMMEQVVVIIE